MVSHVFCFTLYALVPKIHKSLLIPERKYFNERKHMHSLCLRRRSSRNFRFFTVNSQREYTLEIDFFYWNLMWVVAWCVQLLYGPGSTRHLEAWLTLFMWVFRYMLKYLVELELMLGCKYLLGQASRLKVSLFFPSNTASNSSHTIHLEALAVNLSGDVTQGSGEYILSLL